MDFNLSYNAGWGRSQEVCGDDSMHMGKMGNGASAKGVVLGLIAGRVATAEESIKQE